MNVILNARTHPVEGGSANDYEYAAGDPVNGFDLDGKRCWTGRNANGCKAFLEASGVSGEATALWSSLQRGSWRERSLAAP